MISKRVDACHTLQHTCSLSEIFAAAHVHMNCALRDAFTFVTDLHL